MGTWGWLCSHPQGMLSILPGPSELEENIAAGILQTPADLASWCSTMGEDHQNHQLTEILGAVDTCGEGLTRLQSGRIPERRGAGSET